MTENVTRLPVRNKGEPKVLKVADTFAGCQHKNALVDRKLNELECADCHAKLNPMEFLHRLACELTSWEYQRSQLIDARKQLEERKQCRCTKCGQMTEIRRVGKREIKSLQMGKSGG